MTDYYVYILANRRRGTIRAEKRIKRWRRDYKIAMIEDRNPDWLDLFDELVR